MARICANLCTIRRRPLNSRDMYGHNLKVMRWDLLAHALDTSFTFHSYVWCRLLIKVWRMPCLQLASVCSSWSRAYYKSDHLHFQKGGIKEAAWWIPKVQFCIFVKCLFNGGLFGLILYLPILNCSHFFHHWSERRWFFSPTVFSTDS